MTKTGLRILFVLLAWAVCLGATLSIANSPGDWGHSICGAWGCGPPLQALVSCHLSWFVVLTPLAIALGMTNRVSGATLHKIGASLCIASVAMLVAIVVHERMTWWPLVGEWQRGFFWQRCGFYVATMIDVPTVQLLVLGLYLFLRRRTDLSILPEEVAENRVGADSVA